MNACVTNGRHHSRPRLISAHEPLQVLGGNTIAPRINGHYPVFIAADTDEQAIQVLIELRMLVEGIGKSTHIYDPEVSVESWLQAQTLEAGSCVPILSSAWLRGGRFTIAGSRRGRAISRFPASRGWTSDDALVSVVWHQVVFISERPGNSHGPKGVAAQIASYLRR